MPQYLMKAMLAGAMAVAERGWVIADPYDISCLLCVFFSLSGEKKTHKALNIIGRRKSYTIEG
jgi:hypothetical protein